MINLLFLFLVQTTYADPNCLTSREFITSLEFIRNDGDFHMKEQEARELALKISEGCTGAAKRFIRVAKVISKAGENRKMASETGLKFSKGTDSETDSFIKVFQMALAEDGLDMDLNNSIKIALSLSREFKGDVEHARKDFEKIVEYCADSNTLGLPRLHCGPFAAKIAKYGESWKDGVSKAFIKTFEYLKSDSGPALITADALRVADRMIEHGPLTYENYSQAYQYAISKNGLGLSRDEAVKFATKMASITTDDVKNSEKVINPESKKQKN